MFPKNIRYDMAQEYYLNPTKSSKSITRNKQYPKEDKKEFFTEFAVETDIFTGENLFPDWVFDFREENLTKLSPSVKNLCRNLRKLGIVFKIKYPVKIFDKWKFADIYIPKTRTVIIVLSSYKNGHSPCNVMPDRAKFFQDKFKVIDLYEYNAGDINYLKKRLMVQ